MEIIEECMATLCHPVVLFVQAQGCAILLGLAFGWLFVISVRSRALHRVKKGSGLHADGSDPSVRKRKKVSVVLPVKGIGQYSISNWRSQVESEYNGPLEFIFVLESPEDAAYDVLLGLQRELQGKTDIRVQIAGQSWKCSQKIHNQLAGVEAMTPDSEYVLFLDDDIRIHPSTITDLVAALDGDPKTFLVTGYPFDIPTNHIASYCFLDYHLPLFIGFSTGGTTTFVWGGCMLLRAADFRENRYGLVGVLKNGGYSDDMTLGAIAGEHSRRICVPDTAVFLHPLSSDLTMAKYWNYLRRQIFVLETYHSVFSWFLHRALLLVHCWLSWGLVSPIIPSTIHLLLATSKIFLLSPTSPLTCTSGVVLSCIWASSVLVTWGVLYCMTRTVLDLCTALDPKAPQVPISTFTWHKLFVGITIGNLVYPICGFYTWLQPNVEWSGVVYSRMAGKIRSVIRPNKENRARGTVDRKGMGQKSLANGLVDIFGSVTNRIKFMKAER